MKLYRLKIRPLSGWITPWQADTLFGLLCCVAARRFGEPALVNKIIEPALAGTPPFVLSDAFPGDLLPVPITVRLWRWPALDYKSIKRARWLQQEAFRTLQDGREIKSDQLLPDLSQNRVVRYRNRIGRLSDTTGDDSLFSVSETFLSMGDQRSRSPIYCGEEPYLSIYVRVGDDYRALVLDLFGALSETGFGADTSSGAGQFVVTSDLERMDQLDDEHGQPGGVVILSTFQPARRDPTDGYWEAFIKYGKVGPDLGLENVTKRPMVMLKPGACFHVGAQTPYLGRALPAADYIDESMSAQLRNLQVQIIHPSFGLAVPFPLDQDYAHN